MPMRTSVKEALVTDQAIGAPAESAPARLKLSGDVVGQAASPQAMRRLNEALKELKAIAALPYLQASVKAIQRNDPKTGSELALKALEQDERSGYGWYLLAIARELSGDFRSSLECYEAALALMPDHADVANDIGRLAARLGMKPVAEQLFRVFVAAHPENLDGHNNLACVLRDMNRYDDAIAALRPVIQANPTAAMLWNTLATVLAERGDFSESMPFFDESVRLDPKLYKARYNRANALLALGDTAGAIADCTLAMKGQMAEHEAAMMSLALATMHITNGDLATGWDGYEARLSPHYADATLFMIDRPQWTPEADIRGKHILLMGEQGLGDEVLFGNILPDVVDAVGPQGKVYLAVQVRLVSLFQRSFPTVEVGHHNTLKYDAHTVRGAPFIKDQSILDYWAPMASPLRRFRRSVDAFPNRERFLIPDPERVAHWKAVLKDAPQGPKVGLVWKSLKLEGARLRHFSPFEQWRPILETPGVCFVNLQYGDCAEEMEQAWEAFGINIWQPPQIDLKDDLDDVAALCCALDLIIGPANATTNIAAACGVPLWLISAPGAWPRLGTDRYPWYPQTRVFVPPAFNNWGPAMQQAADALRELAQSTPA